MHLVCEDVGYNLQLLNYEERFCARRRRRPFSRLFFAMRASGVAGEDGGMQFWSFVDLVYWLAALAEGREPRIFDPRGEDPQAVITEVIACCSRLGVAADFAPARLKTGYGDAVCSLLLELTAKTLRAERFSWGRHNAAADPDSDVEETPEDDLVDESGILAAGDGDGLSPEDPADAGEASFGEAPMTAEQVVAWRAESARLAAAGHLGTAKLTLGQGGWRVAAIVLDKARGRVLPPVEAAIPALGAVTTTLIEDLARNTPLVHDDLLVKPTERCRVFCAGIGSGD